MIREKNSKLLCRKFERHGDVNVRAYLQVWNRLLEIFATNNIVD